jgi:uncharacterized coiled-coil protein SlyX
MRRAIAVIACLTFILTACVSKVDLQTAEKRASDLQAQVTSLQGQLAEKDTQIESGQAQLDELSSKVASLEADLTRAKSQASSLSREVTKPKRSSQITEMRYDDIMAASTILSAWWVKRPNVESVSTPYRDKIWSNAMTQIHGITYTSSEDHKPYVEHFLVYFDEFEMKPGVFWIGGRCWLDPP